MAEYKGRFGWGRGLCETDFPNTCQGLLGCELVVDGIVVNYPVFHVDTESLEYHTFERGVGGAIRTGDDGKPLVFVRKAKESLVLRDKFEATLTQ